MCALLETVNAAVTLSGEAEGALEPELEVDWHETIAERYAMQANKTSDRERAGFMGGALGVTEFAMPKQSCWAECVLSIGDPG
jgi:hypothetical protein